jgi:hypothetical protein
MKLVETLVSNLAADNHEAFHVVRLNGFIHTDDKLALKEIWRQLGKEMDVEDDLVNKVCCFPNHELQLLLTHISRSDEQLCRHFSLVACITFSPFRDHRG